MYGIILTFKKLPEYLSIRVIIFKKLDQSGRTSAVIHYQNHRYPSAISIVLLVSDFIDPLLQWSQGD